MLHIVSTPIGNLKDLSPRALEILESSDTVLAEDTRRTGKLLSHFGIKKKLISYHKFKEKKSLEPILAELQSGSIMALVSDAGTPCISDPGQILVDAALDAGITVSAIPGPCSVIQALVLSGFPSERFQFVGFLPKNPKETLEQIQCYPGTTVAFESPERLVKTLKMIHPDCQVAVVREMTKIYEECQRGSAQTLLDHFEKKKVLGEIVLVFAPSQLPDDLSVESAVEMLQKLHGYSLKEAIALAAKLKKMKKRDVYQKFHVESIRKFE